MNFILRGAALFGTFASSSGLRLAEEEHAGRQLVCYYFNEEKPVPGDTGGIRFNFSPCFTQVGDYFVVSSTVELARDLIDTLQKPSTLAASPATMRTAIHGTGLARTLEDSRDQILTQTILSQALPPGAARKETESLFALVGRLGTLNLQVHYEPEAFRFDVQWKLK